MPRLPCPGLATLNEASRRARAMRSWRPTGRRTYAPSTSIRGASGPRPAASGTWATSGRPRVRCGMRCWPGSRSTRKLTPRSVLRSARRPAPGSPRSPRPRQVRVGSTKRWAGVTGNSRPPPGTRAAPSSPRRAVQAPARRHSAPRRLHLATAAGASSQAARMALHRRRGCAPTPGGRAKEVHHAPHSQPDPRHRADHPSDPLADPGPARGPRADGRSAFPTPRLAPGPVGGLTAAPGSRAPT